MADIVGSLFGLSVPELEAQRRQQQQLENQNYAAMLGRNSPAPGRTYNQALIGRSLGQAIGQGLFGVQDPMIERATQLEGILKKTQDELGADAQDPVKLYGTLSRNLGQVPELSREAGKALQLYQEAGKNQAQTAKLNAEAAAKEQEALKQKQGQEAIAKLWQSKQELGQTPTNEEIINVAAQFMPAEKLATLMQTSADKAAYRQTMLDQAKISAEARVQAAQDRNASAKEMEQIRSDNRKELAILAASLKPKDAGGSKSSVYERGYANNFVTSSAELVPATTNLNILTNGGTSPITAGVFTNLKGTGLLSATGAAFGTSVTSTEAGQYESIMLPVIANIATMQNAGRRTTQAQVENLKNALIAKPGQPYLVQVQKMGELRQIVEAASDAAKTNPAMSEDQLASIQGNVERVKQAIPFTGADVAKFSMFAKKNPGVKFVDWLKVNGEDKEAFGSSAIPQGAIDKLKASPNLAADFDAKFGAGASKKYLKQENK
jgi:hypothetical protein